jgi:hypothetical protein
MFVFEERLTNHPGKGRYWRIDISKGTGNKQNCKHKAGKQGGQKYGNEDGEDEGEYLYDDKDEDKAGSKDQAHRRPYSVHSLHHTENSTGIPAFTYPDGTSFDPSHGLAQTQSPPSILLPTRQDMNMNYMMGAPSLSSQLDFQSPTDFHHGPFPNMNTPPFWDQSTSYPPTSSSYSSLNPPGANLLWAMSLPPMGPIYHPGPHVEMAH